MPTKFMFPLALTLPLLSLLACDPEIDLDDDATLEHAPLDTPQPPDSFIAALTGGDSEIAQDLARADDTGDALVLLQNSCAESTPEPCSALSLFENSDARTSHLLSLDDHPDSINYQNTPPDNGANVWIMGDWNGDGLESPGYYSKGKFRYTDNPFTPTNSWSAQITLHPWNNNEPNRPLVAGRFLDDYDSDCVGIIQDAGPDNNGNTRFYLEYWCDLPMSIVDGTQWIGAILPASTFPAGEHEFAAGDWDGDEIDEIAVRKDLFITYNLVDVESGNAAFSQAQRWGVPGGELPETGTFVSGDWDGDGVDGWGVLYDDNHFYYRNSLAWNPGDYYLQHIDNLFPNRSVSSHQFGLY